MVGLRNSNSKSGKLLMLYGKTEMFTLKSVWNITKLKKLNWWRTFTSYSILLFYLPWNGTYALNN